MRPKGMWPGALALALLAVTSASASSVLGLSIEDQARLSSIVVVGEVTGQTGSIHPDNGLETAVRLKVTDVLKGRVRTGQEVVFHTRGGEADGEISVAVGEAVLKTGRTYLVFLERVDGRLHNLGLSMGVWDVATGSDGLTAFTRALEDGLEVVGDVEIERGPVRARDMAARVDLASRRPGFDHPMLRARLAAQEGR